VHRAKVGKVYGNPPEGLSHDQISEKSIAITSKQEGGRHLKPFSDSMMRIHRVTGEKKIYASGNSSKQTQGIAIQAERKKVQTAASPAARLINR